MFILLITSIFLLMWWHSKREGFKARILVMKKNKSLFDPKKTYTEAKSELSWIDPITYYDATQLHYTDMFTPESLEKIL